MQQEKNYQNKFLNKYSQKYGMSPSGYYLFLLDELDSDEKNIIELNNILKKLGIEFTLEDHKNSSEKKYRTLSIKIDFDTIEKFETRGAGKKKAIAKNNITVGELKELKKTKTNDEIIAPEPPFIGHTKNSKTTNLICLILILRTSYKLISINHLSFHMYHNCKKYHF